MKEMTTKLLTDLDRNLVKFTEHIKEELTNQKENLFNLISTLSKSFTEQENINSGLSHMITSLQRKINCNYTNDGTNWRYKNTNTQV